ncbi:uncharacterized protein JCM15063_002750 [Sporobolomyces koalae]|uniref:uncharacterized protein n=1 Tax=Sporobolomyces koalae TaxID=500713 RepID=UPI00317E095D
MTFAAGAGAGAGGSRALATHADHSALESPRSDISGEQLDSRVLSTASPGADPATALHLATPLRPGPPTVPAHAPAADLDAANKKDRPPRPMNAWLLFRTAQVKRLQDANPAERRAQGQLSKVIAELWKSAPPETKRAYEALAKEKKEEHARIYPDYRYAPRGKATKTRRRSHTARTAVHTEPGPPSQDAVARRAPPRAPSVGSSHASPRSRTSSNLELHPQPKRSASSTPIPPPIDTTHSLSRWERPTASSSSSLASPSPYLAWPHSGSAFQPTSDQHLQPSYHGPVSAPPNFPGRSLNEAHENMNPQLYDNDQYATSWSPHPISPQHPYSSTASYFPSTLPVPSHAPRDSNPQVVPSFEYRLYRAPTDPDHLHHQYSYQHPSQHGLPKSPFHHPSPSVEHASSHRDPTRYAPTVHSPYDHPPDQQYEHAYSYCDPSPDTPLYAPSPHPPLEQASQPQEQQQHQGQYDPQPAHQVWRDDPSASHHHHAPHRTYDQQHQYYPTGPP